MTTKKYFREFINKCFYELRMLLRKSVRVLLKLRGIKLLDQPQTITFLQPYQLSVSPEDVVILPDIPNSAESATNIFKREIIVADPSYVWEYKNSSKKAVQLRGGGLYLESKILCTDSTDSGFYKSLKEWKKRPTRFTKTLIAPWSQYIDHISYGGYYDYVIQIAAKLSRIKDILPAEEFSEAVVSYPLFNENYENEYLDLLGIQPAQVADSRHVKYDFDRVIFGNKGRWIFPHKDDLFSIKKNVESSLNISQTSKNRIYVSRSGRRSVTNEEQLICLLKRFDFSVIEDKPRSVTEQVRIYKNASFILGPHGASFANMIWCEPGTHLFELFSPEYISPFFPYMAEALGLKYSAYAHDDLHRDHYFGIKNPIDVAREKLERSMYVSIPDLEKKLNELFRNRHMVSTHSRIA